jgi:sugar phosphate isomerase/epimerase
MKLSVQTCGTLEMIGIEAGMKAIADAGFDALDFGLDGFYKWEELTSGKKCDFFEEENLYAYVNKVKAEADKYGIEFGQVHAPFPLFVPKSPKGGENVKADVAKSIEICARVGCPRIVIHPIFDGSARFPSMTKEEEIKANMEYYTSIIPLLKKYGVVCCLENMWGQDWKTKKVYTGACSEINEVINYIDTLNEIAGERCFGFCLDIGHLLLLGQDPCYWIEKLGDRLETLHVHDNDGVSDEHILPYLGCANWERFVLGLRKIGYSRNFSFEVSCFNRKFPSELIPSALKLTADTGRYFIGRITAETDETDEYR